MVIVARGIARGHVRTMTTVMTANDGNDGVAQHGSHTPNNSLTDTQPWFTVYLFDTGQPCYNH